MLLAGMGSYKAGQRLPARADRTPSTPASARGRRDLAECAVDLHVEDDEAAQILRAGSSPNSLVLMDEIGRAPALHMVFAPGRGHCQAPARRAQCFTLFATHHFELTTFPPSTTPR